MKNPVIVIFGADDHEAQAAKKLALAAGLEIADATVDGVKCHAGNAYQANGSTCDTTHSGIHCILFECGEGASNGLNTIAVCDHHRPGDYGYDLPPYQFWQASSLGQLAKHLGYGEDAEKAAKAMKVGEQWLLMVAANDHCPANAYRGDCIGITSNEFHEFRLALLMEQFGEHRVKTLVAFWNKELKDGAILNVSDIRGLGPLKDRDEKACLAEVGLSQGMGYIYLSINGGGNQEICLGGSNSPKTVEAVMEWMEKVTGNKPYGVPSRGYAGVLA